MIEFNLQGLPDLYADFKQLGFAAQKNVLVRAARAGAQILADRAGQLAPVDSGDLRDAMMITTAGQKADLFEVTILVGPSTSAFYGGFQELGTSHHPDQPFIDPAFRDREDDALEAIAASLDRDIAKALAA